MGRKKTVTKGSWKPIRVKVEWLSMLRAACKVNKQHSETLPFDPDTASDPKMLEFACDIASWVASGGFRQHLKPEVAKVALSAATQVAAEFNSTIVTNADGSLSVIKPDQDHKVTVPALAPIPIPLPKSFLH